VALLLQLKSFVVPMCIKSAFECWDEMPHLLLSSNPFHSKFVNLTWMSNDKIQALCSCSECRMVGFKTRCACDLNVEVIQT